MSTKAPTLISEKNLSYAWARAFLLVMGQDRRELAPLIVSIEGFTASVPSEDSNVRHTLDQELARHGKYSCSESASVIFPYRTWRFRGQPNIEEASKFYINKLLPRLKARDSRNRRGTYFQRMIQFHGSKKVNGTLESTAKNQLAHVIEVWRRATANGRRPRASALQLACFDPVKDHSGSALSGFPCLQQVSFAYDDAGLAVNAYYPTQYIFDRAYGNYLGLCHLGEFVARELLLDLVRVNCFIGQPDLGDITKSELNDLAGFLREALAASEATELHERSIRGQS